MIDSDKPMERKVSRKVVYGRKEGVKGERRQEGKKNRGVKTFHSLGITSSVHMYHCSLRVRAHPALSVVIKLLFPQGGRGVG